MNALALVLWVGGAWANTAGTQVVERERILSSEALNIGECQPVQDKTVPGMVRGLMTPQFAVAVSERLNMESYLVSVSREGWSREPAETIVADSSRPFEMLETYTKRFAGPNAATECNLFVASLREHPTFRYRAARPTNNAAAVGHP